MAHWTDKGRVLNEAKRPKLAENSEKKNTRQTATRTKLKAVRTNIQVKVTFIQQEIKNLKDEIAQLLGPFQSHEQDLNKMKTTLEQSTATNLALKQELEATKKKLKDKIEES